MHGHITAEDEPHLLEICSRLHRKHDLFIDPSSCKAYHPRVNATSLSQLP